MTRADKLITLFEKVDIPLLIVISTLLIPFTEWINIHIVNRIKTIIWLFPLFIISILFISAYILNKINVISIKNLFKPENLCVAFLLFLLVFSCFGNSYGNNLVNYKAVIILFSGLFYLVLSNFKFDSDHIRRIIKAFIAVGFLVILISYLQIITGVYSFYRPSFNRITSVFWDPNIYARFLVLLDTLCLCLLFLYKNHISRFQKLFLYLTIFLSLLPLYMTYSRSGILLIVIGVCLVFFFVIKNKIVLISIIIMSFGTGYFGMTALKQAERFKKEKTLFVDVSTLLRVLLVLGAVETIKENPIRGVGYDNFEVVYVKKYQPSFARSITQETNVKVLHNTILAIWAEMGLGAVLSYILWNIIVIWKLLKFKIEDPLRHTFKVWAVISFILFFVFGQLYFSYLIEPVFWLIAYFTTIAVNGYEPQAESKMKPDLITIDHR